MTDKDFVLTTMQQAGLTQAKALQEKAPEMTGTELYSAEDYIPDFQAAKAAKNMLERPVGFLCRSSAGRVVKLLQVYDSTVYTHEPEDLPAQWGFYWSTDPEKALPFIAMSTSPYMTGDCCTEGGKTWRSTIDNNVWAPSAYPAGWELADGGEVDPEEPEPVEPVDPSPEPEPEPEPEPTIYPEYVQPTGSHDAYNTGDRVTYNGKAYESLIDNNVWPPDAYPQGWKEVSEVTANA